MIDFEDFNVLFQFLKVENCLLKHWYDSKCWTIVEAMHNIVLWAIIVVVQKITYISMSCDKVTTINNQSWLSVHVYVMEN